MLTTSQVAKLLGRTRHTLLRWARNGKLAIAETTEGGHARYDEKDVLDFILSTYQHKSVDYEWGAWFAGFVDGEGSFSIRAADYQPMFAVGTTSDDSTILDEIKERLGIGEIYHGKGYTNSQGYVSRPCSHFMLSAVDDCHKIVELLRQFPLRTRKAEDFAIWSELVELKLEYRYSHKPHIRAKLQELLEAMQELRRSRKS